MSEHEEIAGRIPPHYIEAEKAVLSAILLDNEAIHAVVTEVREEDFYHPSHQILYRSMVRLRDENQPVDLTTLAAFLKGEGLLESIGGAVTLVGPIFGAMVFVLLEETLSGITEHWMAVFGPLLILVVMFTRRGVYGWLTAPRKRA